MIRAAPTKPPVLLVEDDQNDIFLTRLAFTAAQVQNPLFIAHNGEHAIELLGNAHNSPCLIITDIKMPRVDGFEFLIWLQTQPNLRDIPKLVISSSVLEEDLAKSLLLGATAYFTKPHGLGALVELVKQWKMNYLEGAPCARMS